MSPADVYYTLAAAGVLFTGINTLLIWMLSSRFVSRKEHQDLAAIVAGHATRLERGDAWFDRLEERIKSMPSAEALHELALNMERCNGNLRVAVERMTATEASHKLLREDVNVLRDWLSREGK